MIQTASTIRCGVQHGLRRSFHSVTQHTTVNQMGVPFGRVQHQQQRYQQQNKQPQHHHHEQQQQQLAVNDAVQFQVSLAARVQQINQAIRCVLFCVFLTTSPYDRLFYYSPVCQSIYVTFIG